MTDDSDDIDWSAIPYSADNLDEIWMVIKSEMGETGRVHAYDMKENDVFSDAPYPAATIYRDILPKMRNTLEEQNIIRVETAQPTQGSKRKEWVLVGDEQ